MRYLGLLFRDISTGEASAPISPETQLYARQKHCFCPMRGARECSLLIILLSVLLLSGCGLPGSLYPLDATEQDLVFDATLLGTWWSADPRQTTKWILRSEDQQTYLLGIVEKDHHELWEARLVKVGEARFFDISPRLPSYTEGEDARYLLMTNLHAFFRVQLDKGYLHLLALDPDWLAARLAEDPPPLHVEKRGENMPIITSSTEQLRSFYRQALTDPKAFTEIAVFSRTKPALSMTKKSK